MDVKQKYIFNVLSSLPGSIYWKDKNGIYLGANEEAAKMAGLKSVNELIGKSDHDIFSTKQARQFRENDLMVINSKKEYSVEEISYLPEGKQIIQLSTKKPLFDAKGEVVGIVGNTVDITYLKNIEKELLAAKETAETANNLKSEFIHNMEHDIRTPFSGVWGLTKLMLDEETDPEKKMLLGDIEKCAKELLDYCNNILDFAKTESGIIPILEKKFDLKALIQRIIIMELPESRHKKIALQSDIADDLPAVVIGDQHRIERILLNLVGNAFKFTQQGHVKIIAKVVKRIKNEKIIIQLKVEDTGIGIPKDKQDLIYEKFTRGTPSNKGLYKGTGLGLHVVKQLIKDIKGEIDVVSEEGKGTTFICTIPFKVPLVDQVLNSE